MSISKEELLKGRDVQYASDYTQEISDNLDKLLIPLNKVRDAFGKPMTVNSGWRPPSINGATPGAAAHSKHMIGLAADIADPNNEVMNWVLQNLDLMQELGFFFEDFRWTPGWVHFGLGAPASGKRIFVPSAARPTAPDRWDGQYDSKYDV
jgi:hypothetical protein